LRITEPRRCFLAVDRAFVPYSSSHPLRPRKISLSFCATSSRRADGSRLFALMRKPATEAESVSLCAPVKSSRRFWNLGRFWTSVAELLDIRSRRLLVGLHARPVDDVSMNAVHAFPLFILVLPAFSTTSC